VSAPPLTWLYVPADRMDRVEKAIASRAHAVIVDLEDGVASAAKDEARANIAALPRSDKALFVRINAGSAADLEAVAEIELDGVVVPKVERCEDLPDGFRVHALIETALGLENAFEIASHPGVRGISLGESDLRSQTGALESGLDWARARIVNAAVAAGLTRPPQSVYPQIRDLEGLATSCRRGRELGHLGRAAIHPAQLAVIEQAYLPTRAEVDAARAALDRGLGTLADGAFVDPAMAGAARMVVELADAYGVVS